MISKKGSFLIPSKMQKELQCVGSGLALDELMEASEMSVKLQETFIYDTSHGRSDDSNSIGMAETIISGTGIVKDMYCSIKKLKVSIQLRQQCSSEYSNIGCFFALFFFGAVAVAVAVVSSGFSANSSSKLSMHSCWINCINSSNAASSLSLIARSRKKVRLVVG
jgi:hypothetical protein